LVFVGCATTQGDWQKAKKYDSKYSYKSFLRKHPHSEFSGEERKRIEEIEWSEARQKNTIKSYQHFIKKYPNSGFVQEALDIIETLEWRSAKKTDTIKGYRKFLEKYSNGIYASKATEAIARLKKEKETKAYLAVSKSKVRAALEAFLVRYPNSEYKPLIEQRLSKFSTKLLKKPLLIPYQDLGLHGPVSGPEAAKRSKAMGASFLTRTVGSFIAPSDMIVILQRDARFPNSDLDITPGKLLVEPQHGGYAVKFTSLDGKGFCQLNFSILLPLGTELNVPQNKWIWWGNVEFKGSKIRLREEGVELSRGTELVQIEAKRNVSEKTIADKKAKRGQNQKDYERARSTDTITVCNCTITYDWLKKVAKVSTKVPPPTAKDILNIFSSAGLDKIQIRYYSRSEVNLVGIGTVWGVRLPFLTTKESVTYLPTDNYKSKVIKKAIFDRYSGKLRLWLIAQGKVFTIEYQCEKTNRKF